MIKKLIFIFIFSSLLFSQEGKGSSINFLKNIQNTDNYICIFFGLTQNIFSTPIINQQIGKHSKIKQEDVYELKSFDKYKDSNDERLKTTYSYNSGFLENVKIFSPRYNKNIIMKKCEWSNNGVIDCEEVNFSIADAKNFNFNLREIYEIYPSEMKIIIKRFIELGLFEKITITFNNKFRIKNITKEKFPNTFESYDDKKTKKYSTLKYGEELIKISFNYGYFSGNLDYISSKSSWKKNQRMTPKDLFKNFTINGNIVSNISDVVEYEMPDPIKMGGGGSEIEFRDINNSLKIERTSSYLGFKDKSRFSHYFNYQ